MRPKKAFVLLSGGMDSTTCLHMAIMDYAPSPMALFDPENLEGVDWVEAISVDYGQRHAKEALFAHATCRRLGVKHTILSLRDILGGTGVMLADKSVKIPDISYDEIKGVSPTYVPFRNGTLLSLITAHAQKWVNGEIAARVERLRATDVLPDEQWATAHATTEMKDSCGIYFGAHAEDAQNWAYPDCTPEFIGAMANAIYIGSYFCIRLHTPLEWASKNEIVRLGERLRVDWKGTWSCYAGGEKHCGTCPTCRARKGAFEAASVRDPTDYAA